MNVSPVSLNTTAKTAVTQTGKEVPVRTAANSEGALILLLSLSEANKAKVGPGDTLYYDNKQYGLTRTDGLGRQLIFSELTTLPSQSDVHEGREV